MSLWSFGGARQSTRASTTWAVIAAGIPLFPFRTEKLSPPAPMVLGAQAPGRVGRRPPFRRSEARECGFPTAQISEDLKAAASRPHAVHSRPPGDAAAFGARRLHSV